MEVKEFALKYFRDTLTNGLTVVTVEMPHIHTMEVSMFVRAGLRFETEKNNGVSHFLEHMMFRGNKKYPNSIALNITCDQCAKKLQRIMCFKIGRLIRNLSIGSTVRLIESIARKFFHQIKNLL